MGRVQLAGDSWLREERSGKDFESDELPPSNAHRQPMPGQRPGSAVTAPSNGYDAKHLNRLWGRFRGAKANPKEKKPKK